MAKYFEVRGLLYMFNCLFNHQLFLDVSVLCKLITHTDNAIIEYVLSVKDLRTHAVYRASGNAAIIEECKAFYTCIILAYSSVIKEHGFDAIFHCILPGT